MIWAGLVLFWLACIWGESVPLEAFLIGPALMTAGVIAIERRKRRR
jgi:hypothetical protein